MDGDMEQLNLLKTQHVFMLFDIYFAYLNIFIYICY